MAGIDAQTVLLLHCDGADGSTLFSDSSQYLHAMSRNGVKVDTAQSQFGGASALWQGTTGQWIQTGDSNDWYFASGDFTIDFWVRFNSVGAESTFICQWSQSAGNGSWLLRRIVSGGSRLQLDYRTSGGSNSSVQANWTPSTGTWYHVAVVRTGNVVKFFVNGTQVGSDAAFNVTLNNSPSSLSIGDYSDGGVSSHDGWLDEIRISKGVARWTANFTPPTAPYSVGGGTYTDAPSGGIAFDGTCVSSGAPLAGGDGGGIDAQAVLMLHCDGADASTVFTDVSPSAHVMTRSQIKVDTDQSKFGGASAQFQGLSNQWITTPDSADWNFGSGDFTIDLWAQFAAVGVDQVLIAQWDPAGSGGWYLMATAGATLSFGYRNTVLGVTAATRVFSPTVGPWYHIAIVRSGGGIKLFVDGTQLGGDVAVAATFYDSPQALTIGAYLDGSRPFNGWMDEIRISKGTARWTSNFTPPTAAYAPSTLITATPSGGITLGGSCVTTRAVTVAYAPSGGITFGGSCASTRIVTFTSTPTGGIVLGGPALVGPVKLTVRLLSGSTEIASWQHQLAGNQARVSWTQFQLPSLGVPVIKVTVGKAKLRLKAKPFVTIFEYAVIYDRATLLLRAKPFRAIEPDHIRPDKPTLRLKGKPFTLLMSQQLAIKKPKLILRGKPIARAGVAGLVPSPPHSLILVPLVCQDKGVLTPTAPKSTLLVPTARRSI